MIINKYYFKLIFTDMKPHIVPLSGVLFFVLFCAGEDWTQGLIRAKNELFHWATIHSLSGGFKPSVKIPSSLSTFTTILLLIGTKKNITSTILKESFWKIPKIQFSPTEYSGCQSVSICHPNNLASPSQYTRN